MQWWGLSYSVILTDVLQGTTDAPKGKLRAFTPASFSLVV